ncbi:MAG: RNA-guided endonuclease InsQ/TnpB family protein [Candidatus Hodarchaeales archaeon]|jgi:putative transposase
MLIRRGYKFELHLNNKERTTLLKGANIARFAWNWGLAERLQRYKEQKGNDRYTDAMKQHKLLNSLKKTEFPWIYEVSKCIPQEALRDLEKAFQHFYQDRKYVQTNKRKLRVGFPKFKKKHKTKDSFRLTGTIKVFPHQKRVQLPRLSQLRVKESPVLSPRARILSATVSRTANKWYVTLTVEEEQIIPPRNYNKILGLDAGLARFTTLSSGVPVPKPKFLLKRLMKLRRLSKTHSRKRPGSNNRRKSAQKLAKFHAKVVNTRKDFQHKLSHTLVKNHDVLVLEDLCVKGLIRNKKQSRHWADLAHGEFRRILRYKSAKHGVLFVEVDRWFPSSKLCSNCLIPHPELRLKDRIFSCSFCGFELDRDHNAALNLEQYFYFFIQWQVISHNSVAESSAETLNACGEVTRPAYQQAHLNEAGRIALSEIGQTKP